MILTLTNDFHNTQVTIRVRELPHMITPSQHRRIYRALCGMSDCQRGVIRGPQYHGGTRLEFETEPDIFGDPQLVIYEANEHPDV